MERTCDFNPLGGTRRPLIRRMLNKLAATRGANAKPVRTGKPWPLDTLGLTAGYLIRRRVGLPLGRGGMSGGVSGEVHYVDAGYHIMGTPEPEAVSAGSADT